MMKPNITLTIDRRLDLPGKETARIALTLNAWVSREVADPNDADVQSALMRACTMVEQDLLGGDATPPPRCQTCRFWNTRQEMRTFDEPGPTTCRRHAPIPRPQALPAAGMGGNPSGLATGLKQWPWTNFDDWCGDYQRYTSED